MSEDKKKRKSGKGWHQKREDKEYRDRVTKHSKWFKDQLKKK